jgi:carbamoyltransferase
MPSKATNPWVLGVSASHNGSACLLHGTDPVVAIQEERLTGLKRQRLYGAQPNLAINYCLETAGIGLEDLDLVAVAVQGDISSPQQKPELNPQLTAERHHPPILGVSHHLAHAFSSYAVCGEESAAILIVDGLGSPVRDLDVSERECIITSQPQAWETISLYDAVDGDIHPLEKHVVAEGKWLIRDPGGGMPGFGSLGGMYSAVAQQVFGDPMAAGEVMGLAPFGEPEIDVGDFFHFDGLGFKFHDIVPKRFQTDRRWPDLRTEYQNLACSVQRALSAGIFHLIKRLRSLTNRNCLCYAGGVALNGTINEEIRKSAKFQRLFIPPAAEDSGVAIGAAYWGLSQISRSWRGTRLKADAMGKVYRSCDIQQALSAVTLVEHLPVKDFIEETVERLCAGQIAGWFQGRSELGPRALGQRSILADPRDATVKDRLNLRVKLRDSFRPFAPAILDEHASDWFELPDGDCESPYMLRVCSFAAGRREAVPAVVHVDGTGRVQTVTAADNATLYELLRRFYGRTQVPILLNTSYNMRSEPIVETPEDALWCFLATGLDFCVIGNRLIVKRKEFKSVLDLRPRITAVDYEIPEDPKTGISNILVRVQTRWGLCSHNLPIHVGAILNFVQGTRNGWVIMEQLEKATHTRIEPKWFTSQLMALRRCSVIAFHA